MDLQRPSTKSVEHLGRVVGQHSKGAGECKFKNQRRYRKNVRMD